MSHAERIARGLPPTGPPPPPPPLPPLDEEMAGGEVVPPGHSPHPRGVIPLEPQVVPPGHSPAGPYTRGRDDDGSEWFVGEDYPVQTYESMGMEPPTARGKAKAKAPKVQVRSGNWGAVCVWGRCTREGRLRAPAWVGKEQVARSRGGADSSAQCGRGSCNVCVGGFKRAGVAQR